MSRLLRPYGARYPFNTPDYQGGLIHNLGNVYFVDSNAGNAVDDAAAGHSPEFPFATMDFAIGRCTRDNGDRIYVMQNHLETVTAAAGLALDVAGIDLIGLGRGGNRPQINFTTAVGADMDVDEADIYMENFLFTGGIDALTGPIDINAADFSLINCETRDVTGQTVDFIVTDANADRLQIIGHTHRGAAAAGADTWMSIVGGDDIYIQPAWIDGNFAVACVENVTTAAVNLTFCGSANRPLFARTRNAADVIFTAVAATTGNVGPHIYARLQDNAANITEAFVGAAMQFYADIGIVNADGEAAFRNADGSQMTNITASTDA